MKEIKRTLIENEMKNSYIDYAMSVIMQRALPDIRDGLKPVHRRILFSMYGMNLFYNKPFVKSARIVGECFKYHPHGDASIYDALVRMAQDFSLRYPLVKGHGNFGCFTEDTKIKLLDGTSKSFKELCKIYKKNEIFYVYSVNKKGNIVVGEAKNPRLTKKNTKIIELTLDTGEKIRCTSNHKFLLKNMRYKEAKDLTPKDSLMPGYFKKSPIRGNTELKDYLMIKDNKTEKYIFVHDIVDKYNLKNKKYKVSNGPVRHHINFNKFNNKPNNLERINWKNEEYKNKIIKNKVLHYVNRLISEIGEKNINADNYNNYRTNNCFPKFENAIKYFEDENEMVSLAKKYNHYVIGIKFLDYTEDVYDITVNKFHNFLLDSGVFVHNSIDGHPAAAMRYSEAKLAKIGEELLTDLEKDTVDFIPNFDGSLKEPVVLPCKIPNLLINGSSGIAVGMATNIPPHNISEVIDGVVKFIDNNEISVDELFGVIKGPDFPTGGMICGKSGILNAYKTGRGKINVKAKIDKEEGRLVVKEIPYMLNKTNLIESIANLVKDKKIEGIKDIRDESDKKGMRIVIEIKKSYDLDVVLNQLYNLTSLSSSFGVIMLGLVNNEPKILNLRDMISEFVFHRKNVVVRRSKFELRNAEDRAHILEGLRIALGEIDNVVSLIKKSLNVVEARKGLVSNYNLSEKQANAILDMKLQRLTSLETEKLENEYKGLLVLIKDLRELLGSNEKIFNLIKEELLEVKEKYKDERRTEILDVEEELEKEDLVQENDIVVTVTKSGYIKQVALELYKKQKRGGLGIKGTSVKEEDIVKNIFVTSNLNYLLFFTNKGKVHWLKAYEVPEAGRYSKGKAIINILNLKEGERVNSVLAVKEFKDDYIVFATKKGLVKKTSLKEFSNPRQGGILAINLKEKDEVVQTRISSGNLDFIVCTKKGKAVRFNEKDVEVTGRVSRGVRGIRLVNDEVVGMEVAFDDASLFTVTENGFGKRTSFAEYHRIRRGGKGVKNILVSSRNGNVVGIKTVLENDELILVSEKGIVIRVSVKDISCIGRATQGFRVMRLKHGDKVSMVARVV